MAPLNSTLLVDNALSLFRSLSKNIRTTVAKGETVDKNTFAQTIRTICDTFEHQNQRHLMNYEGANLAKNLTKTKQLELASIVYGLLIKTNQKNPYLVEEFAKRGLDLARRTKDSIHIMARLDDLNNIYRVTEYGSQRHLDILIQEEEILRKIVRHYKDVTKKYNTISRQALSKDHYEFMLCGIKMEIAKIIMDKNPFIAISELESAAKIMHKHGEGTLTTRIRGLLDKAYSRL